MYRPQAKAFQKVIVYKNKHIASIGQKLEQCLNGQEQINFIMQEYYSPERFTIFPDYVNAQIQQEVFTQLVDFDDQSNYGFFLVQILIHYSGEVYSYIEFDGRILSKLKPYFANDRPLRKIVEKVEKMADGESLQSNNVRFIMERILQLNQHKYYLRQVN